MSVTLASLKKISRKYRTEKIHQVIIIIRVLGGMFMGISTCFLMSLLISFFPNGGILVAQARDTLKHQASIIAAAKARPAVSRSRFPSAR